MDYESEYEKYKTELEKFKNENKFVTNKKNEDIPFYLICKFYRDYIVIIKEMKKLVDSAKGKVDDQKYEKMKKYFVSLKPEFKLYTTKFKEISKISGEKVHNLYEKYKKICNDPSKKTESKQIEEQIMNELYGKNTKKTFESSKKEIEKFISKYHVKSVKPELDIEDPKISTERKFVVEKPKIIANRPSLSWKTIVAVGLGLAAGTAVSIAFRSLGTYGLNIVGSIANKKIKDKLNVLEKVRLSNNQNDKIKVGNIRKPRQKKLSDAKVLKKALQKEEFLMNLSWAINSAMVAGTIGMLANPLTPGFDKILGVGLAVPGLINGTKNSTLFKPKKKIAETDKFVDNIKSLDKGLLSTDEIYNTIVTPLSVNMFFVDNNNSLEKVEINSDTKNMNIFDYCNEKGIDINKIKMNVAKHGHEYKPLSEIVEELQNQGISVGSRSR